MINIIIVDDHELYRFGIRASIESRHSTEFRVVAEVGSGYELFAFLKTISADVVLLDIMLPDMSGIEIARRLKTEYPDLKILTISADNSLETVETMLEIGINGFVSKLNSNADTLAEAIRSVMQDLDYFGKDISDIIYKIYVAKKNTTEITSEFSEQEKRVIDLCHEGLPAKLIADRLNISTRTVDWHKSNIFRKLGINSTLEMVQFAVKKGIIRIEN